MTTLREVRREDAGYMLANWTADGALPGYHLPDNEDDMLRLIGEWRSGVYDGKRFIMRLIEENGVPAGLLSLYERENAVSLGISVHPAMQRRGVGSRAVRLAMEEAGREGWRRMISRCRADNAPSIALHRTCGFVQTGTEISRAGRKMILWAAELPLETNGALRNAD